MVAMLSPRCQHCPGFAYDKNGSYREMNTLERNQGTLTLDFVWQLDHPRNIVASRRSARADDDSSISRNVHQVERIRSGT
jgi:hypothetical protein